MTGLTLITPPTEVVTVQEMVAQLRLPAAPADATRLVQMIAAARNRVEGETRRALSPQTWELSLDAAPCGRWIEFPKPPLSEVVSITTYDLADAPTEVLPTATNTFADYLVDTSTLFGRLILKHGRTWPSHLRETRAIVVRFTCGWSASALPQTLKDAVILLASHWYDAGRAPVVVGSIATEIPLTVRMLLENGDNTVRRGFA